MNVNHTDGVRGTQASSFDVSRLQGFLHHAQKLAARARPADDPRMTELEYTLLEVGSEVMVLIGAVTVPSGVRGTPSPFEAFVDLAGRFGWDTEQEFAGGLFKDKRLQAAWDALASHAPLPSGVMAFPSPPKNRPAEPVNISDCCVKCLREGVLRWADECAAHGRKSHPDEVSVDDYIASLPPEDQQAVANEREWARNAGVGVVCPGSSQKGNSQ